MNEKTNYQIVIIACMILFILLNTVNITGIGICIFSLLVGIQIGEKKNV